MNNKFAKTFHKILNTTLQPIRTFTFLNLVLFLLLNLTLSTFGNLYAQSKEAGLEEMFAIFSEEHIPVLRKIIRGKIYGQ